MTKHSSKVEPDIESGSPRLTKPGSLEAKFKLLSLLPYDERARRRHILLYGFILDWYHDKYGNALASVRHIVDTIRERDPFNKGLSLVYVHSTLVDLVAWGYLLQEKGSGKRASRYVPNWDLVCGGSSVHPVENTTSVHPVLNTRVHPVLNANPSSVHPVLNEDPSTVPGLQTEVLVEGTSDADPTGDGLPATPSGRTEGFEALWSAYGVRTKRIEARAAFNALAPDAEMLAVLVEAAGRWREAYDREGREPRYRKQLHTWLKGECWHEDGPAAAPTARGTAKDSRAKAVEIDCYYTEHWDDDDGYLRVTMRGQTGWTNIYGAQAEAVIAAVAAAGIKDQCPGLVIANPGAIFPSANDNGPRTIGEVQHG